jgi:hypothetical protein
VVDAAAAQPDAAAMHFAETQRFAAWIRGAVLLPVVAAAGLALALAIDGALGGAIVAAVLAALFAALALPTILMRLVVELDARQLRLHIESSGLPAPCLPPADQRIALSDIARCEVHTYRALADREYWGSHFWGLGTGRRGRAFLYLMKGGPGVQLDLRDGTRLLVGSARPHALADAISLQLRV